MARVISNIIGIGGEKSRRFSSLSVSMVLLALNIRNFIPTFISNVADINVIIQYFLSYDCFITVR